MSKKSAFIAILIAVIVAGGGGFYGGMEYQKSKQPSLPTGMGGMPSGNINFNGNVNRTRGGNMGVGGGVQGTVTSVSGDTVTIKMTDGSSKIVLLSSSTTVQNTVTASIDDVTVGTTIMAIGTSNSDGSVTATTVQLNPSTTSMGGTPPTDTQNSPST